MWPNPEFPADLVRFTEKILNEKNLFFFAVHYHPFYFVNIGRSSKYSGFSSNK